MRPTMFTSFEVTNKVFFSFVFVSPLLFFLGKKVTKDLKGEDVTKTEMWLVASISWRLLGVSFFLIYLQ